GWCRTAVPPRTRAPLARRAPRPRAGTRRRTAAAWRPSRDRAARAARRRRGRRRGCWWCRDRYRRRAPSWVRALLERLLDVSLQRAQVGDLRQPALQLVEHGGHGRIGGVPGRGATLQLGDQAAHPLLAHHAPRRPQESARTRRAAAPAVAHGLELLLRLEHERGQRGRDLVVALAERRAVQV